MIPLTSLVLSSNFTSFNWFAIVGIALLLVCSAFFSSSETAYSTANSIRMRNFADEKVKGARKAVWIMEHYDKTLSTILVGNNLVNIASTTIAAYVFALLISNPTLANILNTVVMTVVVLIFGEILPKAMAKMNPEKFALKFSGIMFFLIKLFTPLTLFFLGIQKLVLKKVKTSDAPTVTEDELESIIDTMQEEGVINSDDADLFQGVIDIAEKTVYDVMTPRVDVIAFDIADDIDVIKSLFLEHSFSRMPVYDGDKDHIIGILNQKDLFAAMLKNAKFDIKKLISPCVFVAENMKINDLIKFMQKEKKHMAIVLDEHGGTSGIVTMEDALEEVVGEIYDEHDETEKADFIQLSENNYDIDAEIDLSDLFEKLEIEHVPDSEYSTLGGFLYELAENLPEINQELSYVTIDEMMNEKGNYIEKTARLNFKITEMFEKRIKRVNLNVVYLDDTNKNEEEKSN